MSRVDEFSKEELEYIVKNSESKTEVKTKVGYQSGTRWSLVGDKLDYYGIDYSHLLQFRYRANSGVGSNPKPLEEYLVENSTAHRKNIKRRLIAEGYLEDKCAVCGLMSEWNGKSITMHLDHINGVNNDNRLHNLRLLCPNCHSQTSTYGGSNRSMDISKYLEEDVFLKLYEDFMDDRIPLKEVYKRNNITEIGLKKVFTLKGLSHRRTEHGVYVKKKPVGTIHSCSGCEKKEDFDGNLCSICEYNDGLLRARKVKDRPDSEELYDLLIKNSFTEVGRMFGVSDNSVRKWCKSYGLSSKASYYRKVSKDKNKKYIAGVKS